MAENGTLSSAQRRTIQVLLQSHGIRAACVTAQIAERTVYRWLKDPSFVSELHQAESAVFGGVVRSVIASCTAAVDVLVRIMTDDLQPASARVAAAGRILESALRLHEAITIAERLTALERGQNDST